MTAAYHKKIIEIQEAISKREMNRLVLEKDLWRIRKKREESYEKLRNNLNNLKREIVEEESIHRRNIEILHTKINSQKKQCQILRIRAKDLKTREELSKILLGVKNSSKIKWNNDEFGFNKNTALINQIQPGESHVTEGTQTTPRVSTARTFPFTTDEDFLNSGVQVSKNSVLLTKKTELCQFNNVTLDHNNDIEKNCSDIKNLQKPKIHDLEKEKIFKNPKDVKEALYVEENLVDFSLKKKSNFDQDNMKKKVNYAHQKEKISETIKNSERSEIGIISFEEEFTSNSNGLIQLNKPANVVISEKSLRHDNPYNKSAKMMLERSDNNNIANKEQKEMNNGFTMSGRKINIANVIEETISSKQSSMTNIDQKNCNDYNHPSKIEEEKPKISSVKDKSELDKSEKGVFNVGLHDNKSGIKNSQISLPSSPKSEQRSSLNEIENLNVNVTEYNESLTLLEKKTKDDQKISESIDKSNEGNGESITPLLTPKISDAKPIENKVKFKNSTTENDQQQRKNSEENVKMKKECAPISTANSPEQDKDDAYRKMLSKISENNRDKEYREYDITKAQSFPTTSSAYDVESIDSVEAAIQEATATRRNSTTFSKRSEMNEEELSSTRPSQNERISETINRDSQESSNLEGTNLLKSASPIKIRLHSDSESSIQMSAGADSLGSDEDDDSQFW